MRKEVIVVDLDDVVVDTAGAIVSYINANSGQVDGQS